MAVSLILCINYQHKQLSHLSINSPVFSLGRYFPHKLLHASDIAFLDVSYMHCSLAIVTRYPLKFWDCEKIGLRWRRWTCAQCASQCASPRPAPVFFAHVDFNLCWCRCACTRLFRVMHAGRGLGIYTVHSLKEEMGVEAIYSRCRALHSNRVFCLTSSSSTAALLCSLQQQQQQQQQLA